MEMHYYVQQQIFIDGTHPFYASQWFDPIEYSNKIKR